MVNFAYVWAGSFLARWDQTPRGRGTPPIEEVAGGREYHHPFPPPKLPSHTARKRGTLPPSISVIPGQLTQGRGCVILEVLWWVNMQRDVEMDLEYALPQIRGKRRVGLSLGKVTPLEAEDLLELSLREDCPTKGPERVKSIRHSHHTLAQTLASGATGVEASAITGYCPSRISILQKDPAFKELVEFYRKQTQEVFIDGQARLVGVMLDAVGELQERLSETPELIQTRELTEIIKTTADRAGYGPSVTQNVNIQSLDLVELKRMKEEAKESHLGVVENRV